MLDEFPVETPEDVPINTGPPQLEGFDPEIPDVEPIRSNATTYPPNTPTASRYALRRLGERPVTFPARGAAMVGLLAVVLVVAVAWRLMRDPYQNTFQAHPAERGSQAFGYATLGGAQPKIEHTDQGGRANLPARTQEIVVPDLIVGSAASRPKNMASAPAETRRQSQIRREQAPVDANERIASRSPQGPTPLFKEPLAPALLEEILPLARFTPAGEVAPSTGIDRVMPSGRPNAMSIPEMIVDEEPAVRDVIREYEKAYEQLDAAAAKRVWPAVDERALARAFSGLKSQRLTFAPCDIDITDNGARASCRGYATYVRRVGNTIGQIQQGDWRFVLRKSNTSWQIDSVRLQPLPYGSNE